MDNNRIVSSDAYGDPRLWRNICDGSIKTTTAPTRMETVGQVKPPEYESDQRATTVLVKQSADFQVISTIPIGCGNSAHGKSRISNRDPQRR
jgi:hypothetical protein